MWPKGNQFMLRILHFSSLFLMGLAACGGDSKELVTVTDSAGISLTLNEGLPKTFAELDSEPVLSLGGSDVSGPTQFFRIQNIHVDSKHRLWVADGQSAEIRIFRPDGSHWKTVGGIGEGPGEFRGIRLLGSFHGDSVAVWDNALARLTVLNEEGDLVRTQQTPSGEGPSIRGFDVFDDGSLLGQVPRIISAGSVEAGQLIGDSVHLVRLETRDSTQRFWASALGPLWLWTGRSQVPIPFTINASFDVLGEELHLVSGPEFRIRVFDSGTLSGIYGITREPREVTDADVASYQAFVQEYVPEGGRPDYLSALDHPQVPRNLPAYSRLLVTSTDLVWAQIYSSDAFGPAAWDVFNRLGGWLGQVETPSGFRVLNVSRDRVTGVWRSELGVEHVRVYQIHTGQEAT
jgi:hypothetical protein